MAIFARYVAMARGAGLPTSRLGWRIYVVTGRDFDLYAYTIIGARGEMEAMEIARLVITPGDCQLRAKLVTIDEKDLPPPPLSEENQS